MIGRPSRNFYKDIETILKRENEDLYEEFLVIKATKNPKEVYLWLDSKLDGVQVSDDLGEVLQDFFFSIH